MLVVDYVQLIDWKWKLTNTYITQHTENRSFNKSVFFFEKSSFYQVPKSEQWVWTQFNHHGRCHRTFTTKPLILFLAFIILSCTKNSNSQTTAKHFEIKRHQTNPTQIYTSEVSSEALILAIFAQLNSLEVMQKLFHHIYPFDYESGKLHWREPSRLFSSFLCLLIKQKSFSVSRVCSCFIEYLWKLLQIEHVECISR